MTCQIFDRKEYSEVDFAAVRLHGLYFLNNN